MSRYNAITLAINANRQKMAQRPLQMTSFLQCRGERQYLFKVEQFEQ